MDIVYIGAFRFPDKDAAASRVLNNARIFRALGNDVRFISWGGRYLPSDLTEDGQYIHDAFPYTITGDLDVQGSFYVKLRHYITRAKNSIKHVETLDRKPDVIIAYNADYLLTVRLLRYCRKKNIKFVNDITEWYDYREIPVIERPFYWYNMFCLQHKIRNKIVISHYLDNYYSKSNNLKIPPLCDGNEKKWQTEIADNRVPHYDGITLIYAGNPAKKDSIDCIINAVDRLAKEGGRIRIIILGIGKDEYLLRNSNRRNIIKLHDNIIFLGRISQDAVPSYYRKADFMVLLRESTRKNNAGFPTKVAESITAGVPVITNQTSDLSEYIKDGHNGFIVPCCSEDVLYDTLKGRILTLDIVSVNDMSKNVRQVSASFDWHTYIGSASLFLKQLR